MGAGQYFRGYDQYIRPIHMAAYEARPDLMRLLIASGASIDAPDRKGRTPVQCVLAPTFFDGESLIGKPTKTTPRQRLTLQVTKQLESHTTRRSTCILWRALTMNPGTQHALHSFSMYHTQNRLSSAAAVCISARFWEQTPFLQAVSLQEIMTSSLT